MRCFKNTHLIFLVCLFTTIYSFIQADKIFVEKITNEHVIPFFKSKELVGLAVVVFYNQQGYIFSYGKADREKSIPVTPDTIFRIGSITKTFTALELALQVNKGRMFLNDPITKYFPALRGGGAIQNVTLLELATHSSSLPRMAPHKSVTRAEVLTYLKTWKPAFPIGSKYLYSNFGFGILGLALENFEGMSYQNMIESNICAPLNMTSTGIMFPTELLKNIATGYSREGKRVGVPKKGILAGSGALSTSAKDMLKYLEANLGLNVPPNLLEAMSLTHKSFLKVNDKLSLGLAWQRLNRNGELIIDKNGGVPGFSSYIGMLPQKKIGIVILSNRRQKGPTQIGRKILLELSKGGIPGNL